MRGNSPHLPQKDLIQFKFQRGDLSLRLESLTSRRAITSSKDTDGSNILIWQQRPTLKHMESRSSRQGSFQIMTKELVLQNLLGQTNILQMLSLIHALRKFLLKKKIKMQGHHKDKDKEVDFRRDLPQNTIGLNQTCIAKYLKVILRTTWSIKKKRIREDRVKLEILNLKTMLEIQWWCWHHQEMHLECSHLIFTLSKLCIPFIPLVQQMNLFILKLRSHMSQIW